MKKEVQALINRRRARAVPAILAGIAGLILIALVLLVVSTFMRGPGQTLIRTSTPTASLTPTRPAATATSAGTRTPVSTETPAATSGPSPTPTPITYTVQSGDNLFSIAEQFRANVCVMMAINDIADASLLAVGQVLIIPGGDVELPTSTPLPTDLPPRTRVRYVVQCGDTLDEIAAKFNSTGTDIARINNITDPLSMRIGDVLEVRVYIATATPTPTSTNTPVATPTSPAPTAAAPAATATP